MFNGTGYERIVLTTYSLDDNIIVLRGPENEASSQILKGVVREALSSGGIYGSADKSRWFYVFLRL